MCLISYMLYDQIDELDGGQSEPSAEELVTYIKSLLKKNIKYVVIMGVAALFIIYFITEQSEAEAPIIVSEEPEIEQDIFVDLAGAVAKPGVYQFSSGSRVADLIAAGGPISNDASAEWLSQNLNLSELLADTQKIYIPFEWEVADEQKLMLEIISPQSDKSDAANIDTKTPKQSEENYSTEGTAQKINVNTASQTDLESLNGIGKVYSQRIIDNRPYIDKSELGVKANIPESTMGKIEDFITF
jgi:competence protein ComEA